MIVTVGSTKGGAGKSTLAVALALARARAGRDVLLVDGDQQATAQTAIALRAEAGRMPAPACVWFNRVLGPQMRSQARRYEDVVLDVGGRDNLASVPPFSCATCCWFRCGRAAPTSGRWPTWRR